MNDRPDKRGYEPYERPGLVIAYVVGTFPIAKGHMVGLGLGGRLVPIEEARSFVGVADEWHQGSPEADRNKKVNVTNCGSFVWIAQGWKPEISDLDRPVWVYDGTGVSPCPLTLQLPAGRIVAIETACGGEPGVRVDIGPGVAKTYGWDAQTVEAAKRWQEAQG